MNKKGSIFHKHGNAAISAFSLVEVVVAMGIITFALVALLGLLVGGLKVNRDSTEESQAVNLLQALVADRQTLVSTNGMPIYTNSSPAYNLFPLTNQYPTVLSNSFYVNEDGVTTNSVATEARYAVNYTIFPPALGAPQQPYIVNFKVSWPAAQATNASSVETTATFKQQ